MTPRRPTLPTMSLCSSSSFSNCQKIRLFFLFSFSGIVLVRKRHLNIILCRLEIFIPPPSADKWVRSVEARHAPVGSFLTLGGLLSLRACASVRQTQRMIFIGKRYERRHTHARTHTLAHARPFSHEHFISAVSSLLANSFY